MTYSTYIAAPKKDAGQQLFLRNIFIPFAFIATQKRRWIRSMGMGD